MGDEEQFKATVAGREVFLRRPTDDQIMGWMGVAGALKEGANEAEDNFDDMVEDVGLIFDAILSAFVEDKDRRQFRRDVVMGRATITDLVEALMPNPDAEAEAPKTGPKPRVRRAK
jgi:hypothetical protein